MTNSRTMRACDSCVKRKAWWYCAADDAFLCQNCDSSVHCANPLARRHDRVKLHSGLLKQEEKVVIGPAWHHACKRKARTPRKVKKFRAVSSMVVPELETESCEEERLLYLVPVLDDYDSKNSKAVSSEYFAGSMPSEKELEEFAADMESLLWRGVGNNEMFSTEELGMVDDQNNNGNREYNNDDDRVYGEVDVCGEMVDMNYECEHEFETSKELGEEESKETKKMIGLRLDYEAVTVEWCASNNGEESSPWMDGERPQFGLDDKEMWGGGGEMELGTAQCQMDMFGRNSRSFDEEREARVSRYREKRRTRLFSKKIRYEVRKLNAEKRPRMKGRFVKRSSLLHTPS